MGARRDDPEDKGVEPGRPVIYTVGTSTRSPEEFLDLLRTHGITAVLDVRRFPTSRRYPHFSRASLTSWLAASGITYHYLGDSLGGYRREGYEAYTRTPAFREGLKQAIDVAARERAAIMCCERFPWRCHRRFIAGHLADLGWQVVHILDRQRTYLVPRPTSGRNESPASAGSPRSKRGAHRGREGQQEFGQKASNCRSKPSGGGGMTDTGCPSWGN